MARMVGNKGVGEKPKNFFGSIKNILVYCKAYLPMKNRKSVKVTRCWADRF